MWKRASPDGADADSVEVIDLADRHVESYLVCLEGWSAEMEEAGDHKARWYETAKEQGLRVKVAVDDTDRAVGMIQYVPIELSPAEGRDLYMILCIWVHGYKRGVGDVQGQGIGTALLVAAEEDVRSIGAKGLAAWGLRLPVWMTSKWFKKHGYVGVDQVGVRELVWKPFVASAEPPRWVEPKPVPAGAEGEVQVTGYLSGWCPAANLVYERARRASAELGTPVNFTTVDTADRDTLLRCGHTEEVFVDGKTLQRGAPPSYAKVRHKIEKRVSRLKRRQRSGQ